MNAIDQKAERKLRERQLLESKKQILRELLKKFGPSLATRPHPRFPNKSLRDSVEYAIERGSLSIVRDTLSAVTRIQGELQPAPMTDGYVVAYGKTYGLNDKFKQYGFSLKKFGSSWAWYREVLSDKTWYWTQTVEALGDGIFAIFVSDFSKIEQSIAESKQVDREMAPESSGDSAPHELDGSIFEVSRWYSMQFKEKHNTAYAFRNLKIHKIKRETERAYLVDAEFFSGIASCCGVCGQELNNDISRATGIGPICAGKIGLPRPTMARAKEIVAQLESLSKAQGTFRDVWIPKSQIKNIQRAARTAAPI